MTVKLHELALRQLLNSHEGPVGREVGLIAELVAVTARENASGSHVGIVTGQLIGGLQSTPRRINDEAAYVIGTHANKGGYNYPTKLDQDYRGKNSEEGWLSGALREVFTLGPP